MELSELIETGIQEIRVAGYKSICSEQHVVLRPLTILAGANSSGKSSMMQSALLLKQSLDASYDPGVLLLNGANVRFTDTEQLFCKTQKGDQKGRLHIGIRVGLNNWLTTYYKRSEEIGLEIERMEVSLAGKQQEFRLGMSSEEIEQLLDDSTKKILPYLNKLGKARWVVIRDRCFLTIALENEGGQGKSRLLMGTGDRMKTDVENYLRGIIHLPALRGNPERTYPVTAVETTFPGTFEKYAASVIARWQKEDNKTALAALGADLKALGLTWKVAAKHVDDTQAELQVGRLINPVTGGARDLVNIADVGFGVSQTLPILVALHVAQKGQLVYIEQPEVHLHPKAQHQLARIFLEAVKRGVRVVVESHSSIFILAVQTLVAEGHLHPDNVQLHWFRREPKTGETQVSSATLDDSGAYGDWPEDFGEVMLKAENDFLSAAESRVLNK